MGSPRSRNRIVARGWYFLGGALLLLFVLVVFDQLLKHPPHVGFCPEDTDWVAVSQDLPRFWAALAGTPEGKAVSEELSRPLHMASLWGRSATGVRPTPLRWRAWMGGQALAAGDGREWLLCVRPGLLARLADVVSGFLSKDEEGGVRRYGLFFYAWRDGFLLVSPWKTWVHRGLEAPVYTGELEQVKGPEALAIAFRGERSARLEFHASPGIPVSGRVANRPGGSTGELRLTGSWPTQPLVFLATCRQDLLLDLLVWVRATAGQAPMASRLEGILEQVASRWELGSLSSPWDPAIKELVFTLEGVDCTETLPVPEMALVLRTHNAKLEEHPLAWFAEGALQVPYSWAGRPGIVVPVLGEKASLCLSSDRELWMAASQEPVMQRLMGRIGPREERQSDLVIRVDWKGIAGVANHLLLRAGTLELIPRQSAQDLSGTWMPYVHALARLGALELEALPEGEWLRFGGHLGAALEYGQ